MTSDEHKTPIPPPPTAIEEVALRWVARCDAGLSREQQLDFDRWLAADPRHLEAFELYDGAWVLCDRLGESRAAPADEDGDGIASMAHFPITATWGRKSRRRVVRKAVAAILAIAAAGAVAFVGWHPTGSRDTIVTAVGETRKVSLADGSSVELNTNSAMSLAFSPDQRRVILNRGEAHFMIAKDYARPFLVEANDVVIRAVGTAFKVRMRPESVDVLVTEGRVRVNDARKGTSLVMPASPRENVVPLASEAVLQAGERAVVPIGAVHSGAANGSTIVANVSPAQVQRELAWQLQQLEFFDSPLSDIVAEFNRYNLRQLVIEDSRLKAMRFGGSFKSNDPARFVRMLMDNYAVEAREIGSETRLRLRR